MELICTSRRPRDPEDGDFAGTLTGGQFAAVKIGGIIDWWITDKPQGLAILI